MACGKSRESVVCILQTTFQYLEFTARGEAESVPAAISLRPSPLNNPWSVSTVSLQKAPEMGPGIG